MPIQTRCPSCSAAVPATAAWCSLCHADLRHAAEPAVASASRATDPEPPDPALRVELEPAGRHAVGTSTALDREAPSGGRHAAGRRAATRPSRQPAARRAAPDLGPDPVALPAEGEPTPEQLDAFAEEMLRRLAVAEKGPSVLDPDELPGGRWGFAAGLTAAFIALLILVGTVVGYFLSR